MSRPRQYKQNGLVVPYITAWTSEETAAPNVERRIGKGGAGLGFRDETEYDRDPEGALWVRQAIAPGKGRARFDTVHALRQRRAMQHLLCQVCGVSVLEEGTGRHLFVLKEVGRPVAEGETTTAPPVCESCAPIAARSCPLLRAGHVAVWVEQPLAWGVSGVLYDSRTLRRIPGDTLVDVAYGTPEIRWIVASRMRVALHDCTAADIRHLLPAAESEACGVP
ncbi:hypothetical protein [Streptomyces sp. NPDC059909]|uniref:hypothetical protein n=1 Tax=Streptomyces sp. NPDC059909 TaxID=3346998 RepID=UPI003667C9B1